MPVACFGALPIKFGLALLMSEAVFPVLFVLAHLLAPFLQPGGLSLRGAYEAEQANKGEGEAATMDWHDTLHLLQGGG